MNISTPEAAVLEKMAALDKNGFAKNGVFSANLVKQAYLALGMEPNFKLLKKAERLDRVTYRVPVAGVVVDDTGPIAVQTRRTKVPVKPMPKLPTPVAPVEVAKIDPNVVEFKQAVARPTLIGAVPPIDPKYVPFGNYKDIERIVRSRKFFPVLITGHSGNGKSTTVMQIHAKLGLPIIRMNFTKKTDEEALIGSKTLVDGNIVVVEGPVITAMRNGCTLLIDEVDAGETNTIMCLQTVLEGRSYYFTALGEYVTPAEGFNIIMTANTKGQGSEDGRYIGTQILNEAFLERIAFTFEQEFPTPAVEKRIIMNIMTENDCVDEPFAEELVKWADAIRRSFADGAVNNLIATRRLEHIVRGFAMFGNKKQSVALAVSRFDVMTRDGFIELFDKICADAPAVSPVTNGAIEQIKEEAPF